VTPRRPRRGRPPLGVDGLTATLTIRLSAAQLAAWRIEAARSGCSIGEWVRLAVEQRDAR
jgi:hypothetical protein